MSDVPIQPDGALEDLSEKNRALLKCLFQSLLMKEYFILTILA